MVTLYLVTMSVWSTIWEYVVSDAQTSRSNKDRCLHPPSLASVQLSLIRLGYHLWLSCPGFRAAALIRLGYHLWLSWTSQYALGRLARTRPCKGKTQKFIGNCFRSPGILLMLGPCVSMDSMCWRTWFGESTCHTLAVMLHQRHRRKAPKPFPMEGETLL